MKAMTTLESIRLYLSALWHTIIWPKTTLGQAVVGYIIFYFVLLWEAETFAEGIAFGASITPASRRRLERAFVD